MLQHATTCYKLDFWNTPFLVLGLVCVPLLILASVRVPKIDKHLEKVIRKPKEIFQDITHDKYQIIGLVFMSLIVMGQFTVIPFVSPSLVINAGLLETELPFI